MIRRTVFSSSVKAIRTTVNNSSVVVAPANNQTNIYPRQFGSAKDEAGVTLNTFAPSSATTKYWIFTAQYETNS
jgi:hypothetical protein